MSVLSSSRPPPRAPLVGRAGELAALLGWLAEDARLIALHGPPGVGKSALAAALATHTERRVFLVNAAGLGRIDDLDAALAGALGLSSPAALDASLAAAAPCVSVIDGADRLGAELGPWLAARAAAGPEHTVLVTSRTRVDAGVGHVLEVAPLSTDEGGASAQLWVERVRQLRGSYAPEPDELAAAAELLRALDGLPLAIELAAARAALIGTPALLRSLATGGGPVTLAEVLDDAWVRLDEPLRVALSRLSVFRGAFDATAAASVIGLEDAVAFEQLHRLRHASMLSAVPSARGAAGELKLRLLGPIREHARKQLEARGEVGVTFARHAACFAAVAARVLAGEAIEPGDPDELALVMDRALDTPHVSIEDALLVALAAERQSWAASAWLHERLPALVRAADDVDEGTFADAALALARLRVRTGPLDEAERLTDRALEIHRRLGDDVGVARALRTRALIASQLGQLSEAEAAVSEAVRLAKPDRALEGLALHTAARIALRLGDHERAVRGYEDALDRHRRVGDRRWQALALSELAIVHIDRAEVDAAEARVDAGLAIEAADPLIEALFLGARGNIAHERGDLDAAIQAYEAAAARADRYGNARYAGLCRGYRGIVLLEQGRAGSAQAALEGAAAAMRAVGDSGHDRLFGAHAVVARVRQGAALDDLASRLAVPEGADAWLAGALGALARGLGVAVPAAEAVGLDARLATRIASARATASTTEPDLVLGPGWFSTPGRGKVDTRRRAAARRILEALVESRGAPLDADQLIAAGWPGERILPTAAKNRLHVTLHRLRDLGLREGLVFADEGWSLDPSLAVVERDA
ncbi:MAG: tetratricopeptide repeat protein [Sandaracinaceae bacterium]|nr:tetratricopeptide repeat protein [Sandaracinaceae bacterium]